MFRKRFTAYQVPADKKYFLLLFANAYYNKTFQLQMESMLSDKNQLSEDDMLSMTDDLNTTLYIGK